MRELCSIYSRLSVYKTFLAEYIFGDATNAYAKLSRVRERLKQMSLVESWLSSQTCFMIEQLTCSLSQRACVCTNKEADCCCPQWFILLFCPPSAPDEKLIKTLSCLLIPFQTVQANHLTPFTTFYYFFMNKRWSQQLVGTACLFFQFDLRPQHKM